MRKLRPESVALIALGLTVGLGLTVPAMAGDLDLPGPAPAYKAVRPVAHAYDWDGFYLGGNVGGHFGTDKITTITDVNFEANPFAGPAIDAFSPATLHPQGLIGGVQAGYNLEGSAGVWGIEVDANWLGGSAMRTLTGIPVVTPGDTMSNTTQGSFLSTLRMRWGSAAVTDRLLLYVTAGFAFETIKTTDSMGQFHNTVIQSNTGTSTQPGLSAGAGFEYAFTDNWSAKFEYLFIKLKNSDITIPPTAAGNDGITVTHEYSEHIGRFGVNYKFGGSGLY